MNIFSVGTELFHADGRTDRHYEVNSRPLKFLLKASNKTQAAGRTQKVIIVPRNATKALTKPVRNRTKLVIYLSN